MAAVLVFIELTFTEQTFKDNRVTDVSIIVADYRNPQHGKLIVELMDCYARDPMGGGQGLNDFAKSRLPAALAEVSGAVTLLCFKADVAVGLMTAFRGFSTFKCQPLLNIHDVVVTPAARRQGLAQAMLTKMTELARAEGCCKLTLEVLEGNTAARAVYTAFGFRGYELDPAMGKALFLELLLADT